MGNDRGERKIIRRVRDALKRTDAEVDVNLVFDCPVEWEQMEPIANAGDTARHCGQCRCRVYDFKETPKSEVVALIRRSGGELCGQVGRRADGRVVFGECTQDRNVRIMRGRMVVTSDLETE